MKKLLSGLCASTLALSFAAASVAPVNAAPIFVPQTIDQTSDVQNVQYRMRGDRGDRWDRWDDDDWDDRRRRIIRRGDNYYMNGHRGFRYYRPGYRRYGDYWFPAAAFLAGALITGAIAADRPRQSAALTSSGAMTAIGPTGTGTTRSSPMTGRAASAIRLTIEANPKRPAAATLRAFSAVPITPSGSA